MCTFAEMKEQKWSKNVILVDADYVDKVAFDLIVNFERMLGRRIPQADMARWLECVALDGGLRPQPSDRPSDFYPSGLSPPETDDGQLPAGLLHRAGRQGIRERAGRVSHQLCTHRANDHDGRSLPGIAAGRQQRPGDGATDDCAQRRLYI